MHIDEDDAMTALVCSILGLALVGGVSLGYKNGTLSSATELDSHANMQVDMLQ